MIIKSFTLFILYHFSYDLTFHTSNINYLQILLINQGIFNITLKKGKTMQKKYISYISIIFISLVALFSGCKKEKSESSKKPFFSKVKDKNKTNLPKKNFDETVNAFDLDNDAMKTFALDDKLSQHSSANQPLGTLSSQNTENKNFFAWENLAAEDSKNNFKKLFFEFDRYSLEPNQLKNLRFDIKEAKKMIKDGKTIVIEGHACHSAGSAAYNLALSEKRARHVASEFAKAGIDPKDIKIAPRGQEMPVVKEGNRQQQAANRRVEIFAIDK